MATGFRVRLGEAPKYRPASAEHPEAVAFARLAESNFKRDDEGNWVDQGATWYDGVFTGRQADLIREYQSGDMLIALGNHRTVETVNDGKSYTNEKLYVNHFSPDLADRAVTVTFDRSARQASAREQRSDPSQEADSSPSDKVPVSGHDLLGAELQQRLDQLVQVNRLTAADAERVALAFQEAKHGAPQAVYHSVWAATDPLPPAEAEWLRSVPRLLVSGEDEPCSWEQALRAVGAENADRVNKPSPKKSMYNRDSRDAPNARTRNEVEAEMSQRLEQLVQVGRVSQQNAHEVLAAFKQVKDRDPDTVYQTVVYASLVLPPVEAEWVKSVPRNLVTGYSPYNWQEAHQAAQAAAPAIPVQSVQPPAPAQVASPAM